jgi:glutathione synthase
MTKGIVVKCKSDEEHLPMKYGACEFEHMAISLVPTPFPRVMYEKAKSLQPHLGVLISQMLR